MTSARFATLKANMDRAVFGLVGSVSTVIGLLDLGSANGLAPRIFAAFLTGIGFLSIVAAIGLRKTRWASWPVWASAVAVLLVGAVALLVEVENRWSYDWSDDRQLAFAVVCLVVGAVMVAIAWWNKPAFPPAFLHGLGNPNKTPLENLKDTIELLGVSGIILAGTGFWFTNIYIPSSELPAVNVQIDPTLSPATAAPAIHTTFVVQNASDFRVRIVSSYFNVVLWRVGGGYQTTGSMCSIEAQAMHDAEAPDSASALGRTLTGVINAGRLLPDGDWLEPHETLTFGIVTPLPVTGAAGGEVARVSADLAVARSDRIAQRSQWRQLPSVPDGQKYPTDAPSCSDMQTLKYVGSVRWPVVEESYFNSLTRDPVEVWTDWWVAHDGEVLASDYLVKGANTQGGGRVFGNTPKSDPKLEQLFGLVATETVEEINLPAKSP